jgi:hypothetical protein
MIQPIPAPIIAAFLLCCFVTATAAEQVSLRCSWDPAERTIGGAPLEPSAVETAKLFDHDHPLRLGIDISTAKLNLAETDALILGFGRVSAVGDDARIEFENLKMRGLVGGTAKLLITIDRFDLSSVLILSLWHDVRGYSDHWLRRGSCKRQIL